MAGIRRSNNVTKRLCMHCGKSICADDSAQSYSMQIMRHHVEPSLDEEDVMLLKVDPIDYYIFCDACFSVLDEMINNDFIKYGPNGAIDIVKEE